MLRMLSLDNSKNWARPQRSRFKCILSQGDLGPEATTQFILSHKGIAVGKQSKINSYVHRREIRYKYKRMNN